MTTIEEKAISFPSSTCIYDAGGSVVVVAAARRNYSSERMTAELDYDNAPLTLQGRSEKDYFQKGFAHFALIVVQRKTERHREKERDT